MIPFTNFNFNLFLIGSFIVAQCSSYVNDVNYMELGNVIIVQSGKSGLKIFCYEGRPKQIINIWQSVSFKIKIANDNFEQYEGFSPQIVFEEYHARRSSWSLGLFSNKKTTFNVNPFNQSCIGIESAETFSVYLNYLRIDFWKLVMLFVGLALFHGGSKFSNNTFLYYSCGITIGIFASFLVLIYFISKIIPKKPAMYGFVIGGWTLSVYFLRMLWDNMRIILISYKAYVIWYIAISGFLSFLICYRIGPIQNHKNKNIIKWTLQGAGLLAVAFHTDYQEAAIAICCIIIISKYFPKSVAQKSKKIWRKRFPPKPILLTSEEYYAQGVAETCKALQELRQHCSSPECKQWSTILKLKDAKRFAKFVEGESHLTDREILDYDSDESYSKKTIKPQYANYQENGTLTVTDDEENDIDRISEDSFDE